jgi:glycosyltransferase involved in cell wall biosynthesis
MPSKQRVLVVAPQPFYEDRGTPIAVRQLIEALTHLDFDIDLVTYPMGENAELAGVRYFRAANPLRLRSVPIGFSWRKLALDATLVHAMHRRMECERYAFIHAVEEAAFPAAWIGRRRGIPVVYDMQSSLPEQMQARRIFRLRVVQFALRRAERWLIRHADFVITSTGLAKRVRQSVPWARVREWTFASLQPAAIDGARVALRRSLGIPEDVRVVLYSGTFASYQGLTELLDAVPLVRRRVPGTVFVLVGAEGRDGEGLVEYSHTLGEDAGLLVLPRQTRQRMPEYLAMADVLVSPRLHGGNLPLKIFDYLAAGRPIVATDIPTHRGVLTEETAVLVQPNARALARGISAVLTEEDLAARLSRQAVAYAQAHLGWLAFVDSVQELSRTVLGPHEPLRGGRPARVAAGHGSDGDNHRVASVVIPARDEAAGIREVVRRVLEQRASGVQLEVIVVDDGSSDDTGAAAEGAGARVIRMARGAYGNPARARNRGAAASAGDPIIFLDADCTPAPGWLEAILSAHASGAVVVGGALDLPPDLSFTARCDYYCGWYLVHSRRPAGWVPHHPPPNLSVRRDAFLSSSRFSERPPLGYTNEERRWQGELRLEGHRVWFEPQAVAYHHNRPGLVHLLRRNYRWAYTAVEAKSESGAARAAWLWRNPRLVVVASFPLALVQAVYILGCWARARRLEPLVMAPLILGSRLAYGLGMMVGGWRWLRRRGSGLPDPGPEWV